MGPRPIVAAALGKASPGVHMRTLHTRLIVLAVALAALLVPPAAALAEASPSPSPSASPLIYRIGIPSDVDNMNPFLTYMGLPWECFRVEYNFLTWYDADYNPTPDLADPVPTVENGGVTEGGRVWTFHLRPNVKWSDGVPLTARDVAYTYNRILRQKLSMYLSYFTGVTGWRRPTTPRWSSPPPSPTP